MARDRHHRKAHVNGGTGAKRNIVRVIKSHHQAFHLLFGTNDTYGIARILNGTWIDPDYELIVHKKT